MPAPSHRMRKTTFYTAWANMKQRCLNSNNIDFINYGGRGIVFCDEWAKFENFKEDMYDSWQSGLTLDRIDVNGNYCKENCRWVTRKRQNNNTRANRYLTYEGVTRTLSEWASFVGIKRSTLSMRLNVYKWNLKDSLNY